LKLVSRANELRQLIDRRLLLIDGKLRVTDDVDEQHMSDLEWGESVSPRRPDRLTVIDCLGGDHKDIQVRDREAQSPTRDGACAPQMRSESREQGAKVSR